MAYMGYYKQTKLPLITNPSVNSKQFQLIVMSWMVNNTINTGNLVPEKALKPTHITSQIWALLMLTIFSE